MNLSYVQVCQIRLRRGNQRGIYEETIFDIYLYTYICIHNMLCECDRSLFNKQSIQYL